MPTDDILIRFRTDSGQLKAEFDEISAKLRQTTQEEKKAGDQAKVTSKDIADAAARRKVLLNAEIGLLKQLEQQSKKAFTPKDIAEFNSKIAQSQKNISLLKGEQDKLAAGTSGLGSSFAKLGGLIAAAFSVQQVIAFGNTAVTKFAEAEKAALQLLGALQGNEAAQKRLLRVAKDFEGRFAIDDDAIIAQQAFLAIQGRTEAQIKKVIEAAIELGAVTGDDLASAVQKLDATFEGNIGKMGKLDSRLKDLSSTQLENGVAVDLLLEKYTGFAEKGLTGVQGELQRTQVEFENTTEKIGGQVAPIKLAVAKYTSAWLDGLRLMFISASDLVDKNKSIILNPFGIFRKTTTDAEDEAAAKADFETQLAFNVKALRGANEKILNEIILANNQRTTFDKTRVIAAKQILQDQLKAQEVAAEKEIETLEKLKNKKEDLEKQQSKVVSPLSTGKAESDALLKQIAATQAKIDEITGKAQEERNRKAKELSDKQNEINKQALEQAALINAQADADDRERIVKKAEADIAQIKATGEAKAVLEKAIREKLATDLAKFDKDLAEKTSKQNLQEIIAAIDLETQRSIDAQQAKFTAIGEIGKDAAEKNEKEISRITIEGEILKDREILSLTNLSTTERLAAEKKLLEDLGKLRANEVVDFAKTEREKLQLIRDTIDAIGESARTFNDLLNANTENQIQVLTDAQQRQTDSFDEQEEHLQDLLDSHKISQDEFEKRSKTLSEQRAKNEKISQDKIKALKLEEAKRNKTLAIFEATLNLAKAISVALSAAPPPFNAVLAAISAVLAGVQLAAVIATPIPAFAKGTKRKQGGGLARVGEQGEEIVFLPDKAKVLPAPKTKQYSDVLDSMFDGSLDKFIHKNYVLPALKLQSPSVNINIDYKKLAKANQQSDSISIDNWDVLLDRLDHNPRRVI